MTTAIKMAALLVASASWFAVGLGCSPALVGLALAAGSLAVTLHLFGN